MTWRTWSAMWSFLVACVVGGANPVSGAELKEGDPSPVVECKDDAGKIWKSADHYGKKIVVYFFYPAAMTGG